MEFWGVEVKPGEAVKCDPGADKYLHLSQASLGEVKKEKGNESIPIFVKFNDQKLVIGTLSSEKCAQISYDLVFEKEFELSHNWKNGSVFFLGYKTVASDDGFDDFSETDSEEDVGLSQKPNGKTAVGDEQMLPIKAAKTKPSAPKTISSATKPKVKVDDSSKAKEDDDDDADDDDDDEDDDEDDDSEDDEDDEDMIGAGDDSDDEEDGSSDDEDEATPKKVETGKKRPALSDSKTPGPEKKAKLVTPQGSKKTGADGKKGGGHIATPYPAKQAAKTPANSDKSKQQQTPKSGGGSVSCKSCSKTFNSEGALLSHTKAKHTAAAGK